jgi:lysine 2,3-aminomutase
MTSASENDYQENEDKPPGGLQVLISPYLKRLSKKSRAVRKEFYPSESEKIVSRLSFVDPLLEDEHTKTKGLVHKYKTRVLILLTMTCASYCRFCTRRRIVGDLRKGTISPQDIDRMVLYLKKHHEVSEVIFSGGDPLTVPALLSLAVKKITQLTTIKVIRIHTRVPVSNPFLINQKILNIFKSVKKQPLYISIHFEHPDEFTRETVRAVEKIRKTGAILLSQSVFLKGINDSYETLNKLFTGLVEIGIRPYYIYHCDPVKGASHFIVPLEKEIEIMTKLKTNLSGIACPAFVIDTPNGSGKIPVPFNYWSFQKNNYCDYNGDIISIQKS